MRVAVIGCWHLGSVTAACLAGAGHDVRAWDPDEQVRASLAAGKAPLFEPGLDDLLAAGLGSGHLQVAPTAADAIGGAEVAWITFDTPVNDEDVADVAFVLDQVEALFPHLGPDQVLLVSSQLPVGTARQISERYHAATGRELTVAVSPENLRLGKAIQVFTQPDRVVVGTDSPEARRTIEALLAPFTSRIEWMSPASAEMTKHAINAFLAMSIAWTNEIAGLCEASGADAREVERGLKTEARIGPGAYVSAGNAFAGGTLARDVVFLGTRAMEAGRPATLLRSIKESNDRHRGWIRDRLAEQLGPGLRGRTVTIWGLAYKPGTSTLRRSSAVEVLAWLREQGATVRAHDPAVSSLAEAGIHDLPLDADPVAALNRADALVIATPWPDFRSIPAGELAPAVAPGLVVVDPGRYLEETFATLPVRYLAVGVART